VAHRRNHLATPPRECEWARASERCTQAQGESRALARELCEPHAAIAQPKRMGHMPESGGVCERQRRRMLGWHLAASLGSGGARRAHTSLSPVWIITAYRARPASAPGRLRVHCLRVASDSLDLTAPSDAPSSCSPPLWLKDRFTLGVRVRVFLRVGCACG